jgi:hypothetical protein
MSDPIQVSYQAYVVSTRIPFRYLAVLYVDDLPTGVQIYAWGKARATRAMRFLVNNGNELINRYGVAAGLAAELYARRREEAMAKVQVGDRVKLLIDIGQFKKGRVCRVAQIPEDSFYEARGGREWDDEQYILVSPIHSPTDNISLGPKDIIPLRRGEFGPLDAEVDE